MFERLEQYGLIFVVAGAAVVVLGFLWLLVRAFRTRFWWGLLSLVPPFWLLFAFRHWPRARVPVLLMLLGLLAAAVPYGANLYRRHFVKLGPHEKVVDGELHITLTGADDFDYAFLKDRRQVVVLQMANDDVDDRTLEYLRGMDQLRELDLSDTQVTDAGLQVLAELPQLKVLKLARNDKITDAGFRKALADKESLAELDLRETAVKAGTLRKWKDAQEGRKFLHRPPRRPAATNPSP